MASLLQIIGLQADKLRILDMAAKFNHGLAINNGHVQKNADPCQAEANALDQAKNEKIFLKQGHPKKFKGNKIDVAETRLQACLADPIEYGKNAKSPFGVRAILPSVYDWWTGQ
jgi:hypothetical protein